MIFLDFETDIKDQSIVCVQWARDDGPVHISQTFGQPMGSPMCGEFTRVIQMALGEGFCAHYAAFEARRIMEFAGKAFAGMMDLYLDGKIACSSLAAQFKDIQTKGDLAKSYSLANLTGKDGNDPWRMRYGELKYVPISQWPTEALAYCHGDITALRDLWTHVGQYARNCEAAFRLECLHQLWADIMGSRGVRVDQARAERLAIELREKAEPLKEGLPFRADGSRDMAALEAMFVEGLDPRLISRTPKSGKVQMDEEILRNHPSEKMRAYGRWLGVGSRLARVQKRYVGAERLRCSFHLSATSRFSSRGIRDDPHSENLTNIPQKGGLRECLIPDEGMTFVIADFSQLEIVSFADVLHRMLGHSPLCELVKQGTDVHSLTASHLVGISYSDFLRRFLAKEPGFSDLRFTAKPANFGFPGGLGENGFVAFALGYGLDLTVEDAAQLKRAWKSTVPEHVAYFAQARAIGHGDGIVTLPNGFKRYCDRFTNTCNTPFQGHGASMAKLATASLFAAGYDCVLFVHDEVVVQIPRSDSRTMSEQAFQISHIMKCAARACLAPDGPPINAEPILADRFSKAAHSAKDADGNLTLWSEAQ